MSVRIATFNVENLMARFDFSGWKNNFSRDRTLSLVDIKNPKQYRDLEQARVIAHADDARQMTALAIADTDADILCLQEVENLETLEAFEDNYVRRMTGLSYPQQHLIEGNDGRGIDVAVIAKEETADGDAIEIVRVRTNADRTFEHLGLHNPRLAEMGNEPSERVFRRDCLEVDVKIGGKPMTLFVCHFKSMGPFRNGLEGRDYTMPMRLAEATAVRRIIERRFGEDRAAKMRWLVCGDLNDYYERLVVTGGKRSGYRFEMLPDEPAGIDPLLADGFAENLVARRPRENRWTLYHAGGPLIPGGEPGARETRHLVQLDYILASPKISRTNGRVVPDIIRNGMPYRTVFPPDQLVERYPRTGWDRPKASDHCPVAVTLDMV